VIGPLLRLDRGARISLALSLLFASIGAIRIVSTYSVFNQTWDEPYSVACGMEWLQSGTYELDPKHPPLGRVAAAALLFLHGVRSSENPDPILDGNSILGSGESYHKRLFAARLGTLPFFLVSCVALWCWSWWAFGSETAAVAVLLFSSLPSILGHAGMAMTDIVLVATLPLALFSFCLWLNRPTIARSLWLGIAVAFAILSKFTAFPFLAVCGVLLIATRYFLSQPPSEKLMVRFTRLLAASLLAAMVIWAGYRFSLTPAPGGISVPAQAFFQGLSDLWQHNQEGQAEYFLGDLRKTGWIYYYPVIFLVKSPIAFLLLLLTGLVFLARTPYRTWPRAAMMAVIVGMFLVGTLSQVSEGVRHMLAVYVPMSALAGFGAHCLFRAGMVARFAAILLVGWQLISSATAHPDYLPYFNELARSKAATGAFGVDSDLDWGQDLWRLSEACQRHQIQSLWVAYNGTANLQAAVQLPDWRLLPPHERKDGWIAVSIYKLKLGQDDDFESYSWIERYQPVERVGKSILLYFIPPA